MQGSSTFSRAVNHLSTPLLLPRSNLGGENSTFALFSLGEALRRSISTPKPSPPVATPSPYLRARLSWGLEVCCTVHTYSLLLHYTPCLVIASIVDSFLHCLCRPLFRYTPSTQPNPTQPTAKFCPTAYRHPHASSIDGLYTVSFLTYPAHSRAEFSRHVVHHRLHHLRHHRES